MIATMKNAILATAFVLLVGIAAVSAQTVTGSIGKGSVTRGTATRATVTATTMLLERWWTSMCATRLSCQRRAAPAASQMP